MDRISLFHEYRLIERSESEINGAWEGAHLLLFFMAFVFGFFCTFCFHMLMYLFDEKCVLFPKLQSLSAMRRNTHEYHAGNTETTTESLPLDFLSTQWVDKSACYLPTYVPLVSGIFGLVWTTMFLMCSTGSRTLTGLGRPWRVLPPVFVFSLAMGGLCVYASVMTHAGLQELCHKLGEITGSTSCTYTVNVATLAYERSIRGVYQATRLTILTAWLHTACWLLSAMLALVRVLMVVDFQLVRVNVELVGDIDKILEFQEEHIHTVSADLWYNPSSDSSEEHRRLHLNSIYYESEKLIRKEDMTNSSVESGGTQCLYFSASPIHNSENSLLNEEQCQILQMEYAFVLGILDEIFNQAIDILNLTETSGLTSLSLTQKEARMLMEVVKQIRQQRTKSKTRLSEPDAFSELDILNLPSEIEIELLEKLRDSLKKSSIEKSQLEMVDQPSTSKRALDRDSQPGPSKRKAKTDEMKILMIKDTSADEVNVELGKQTQNTPRKSILKDVAVQTDKSKKVLITVSKTSSKVAPTETSKEAEEEHVKNEDKETQTKKKDKED